jgi:hypothetical protein
LLELDEAASFFPEPLELSDLLELLLLLLLESPAPLLDEADSEEDELELSELLSERLFLAPFWGRLSVL